MVNSTARIFRTLLGLVIRVAGVGTAAVAVILAMEYAWGWVFLVGPLALIVSMLCLRWGTRLISH